MSTLDNSQQQLIEAVRLLEEAECLDGDIAPVALDSSASFEQRLHQRAMQLAAPWSVKDRLAALSHRLGLLTWLGAALMFVLGAFAAGQAFGIGGQAQQVNFFWLLLVLLGFNALALLFWLGSWLWRARKIQAGWLGQLLLSVNLWFSRHVDQPRQVIARSWFARNAMGSVGFWRFSVVSHGFWLAYLLGGLAAIVVMLMARQFGFFWETTLLSPQRFVAATQALSWLPAQLGFAVPDQSGIVMSQSGHSVAPAHALDLRRQWAGLLMGSVLVYGCALRLLFCAFSFFMLRRALGATRLPLQTPYYIHLRHRLRVADQSLGVVDADEHPADGQVTDADASSQPSAVTLVQPAVLAALELDPACDWPPALFEGDIVAGHAVDRQSQRLVTQAVKDSDLPLIVVVDFWRTPDRGSQRYIRELLAAHGRQATLVLLSAHALNLHEADSDAARKLYAWHGLAAAVGIQPEQMLPRHSTPDWRKEQP